MIRRPAGDPAAPRRQRARARGQQERRSTRACATCPSLIVAYSGGVDSAYLAYAATQALGAARPVRHRRQPQLSRASSRSSRSASPREFGLQHEIIHDRASSTRPEYRANPANRCYYCKHELYTHLSRSARERGIPVIADGSNADDRGDYRPGRQAAREFGVRSPLDEVGLTKDEIRELSRRAGLPTWDEPASACLSSRIPYLQRSDRREAADDRAAEDGAARSRVPRLPRAASRHARAARDRPRRDGARARARGRRPHRSRAAGARLRSTSPSICRATASAASTRRCACARSSDRRRAARRIAARRSPRSFLVGAPAVLPPHARRHRLDQLRARRARLRRRAASAASARLSGVHRARQGVDAAAARDRRGGAGSARPGGVERRRGRRALPLAASTFWRAIDPDPGAPLWSRPCWLPHSPLFWFTALRPLSDVTGLCRRGRRAAPDRACPAARLDRHDADVVLAGPCAGAFLAGLAIGIRSQTLPADRAAARAARGSCRGPRPDDADSPRSLGAAALACRVWAIPLIVASGGLAGYLAALGSQAGEDFSGVVMLWTTRTPRVAVLALLNTFVQPWAWPALAGVMLALAGGGVLFLLGLGRTGSRASLIPIATRSDSNGFRALVLLAIMFAPYALFHLVLQETLTVRYALPISCPLTYLAATAIAAARPGPGLIVRLHPGGRDAFDGCCRRPSPMRRTPSPIFGAFADMAATSDAPPWWRCTAASGPSPGGRGTGPGSRRAVCCRRRAITMAGADARVAGGWRGGPPVRRRPAAAPISR